MDSVMRQPAGSNVAVAIEGRSEDRCYPTLFASNRPNCMPGYKRIVREGTGLVIVSVQHGVLSEAERKAIGQYRLQQYILANMYDPAAVERLGITVDPELERLESRDIHVAVGDTTGRFICYAGFESAFIGPRGASGAERRNPYPLMRDADRLYFPVEADFGGALYASHPAMALLPVIQVREMMRLMRNQASRSPLDRLALVELIVAAARVIADPENSIEAVVGCASPELRRLLRSLGIPIVYAPLAPDNQNFLDFEASAIWTEQSHQPHRFWPVALAAADIRMVMGYFDQLADALSQPPDEVGQAVEALRKPGLLCQPRYAHGDPSQPLSFWTSDPLFTVQ